MSVKFAFYDTPVPKNREKKNQQHARVIPDESIEMGKLCKLISSQTSFSAADVKGILTAFNFWLDFYLKNGSTVNLEGIGRFFPTLHTTTYTDEEGRERIQVGLDTVGFRCSPDLRKQLRMSQLEQVKIKGKRKDTPEQRQKKILSWLGEHFYANASDVMRLNGCNQHMALDDLNRLRQEGKIKRIGKARQTMYVLPY